MREKMAHDKIMKFKDMNIHSKDIDDGVWWPGLEGLEDKGG